MVGVCGPYGLVRVGRDPGLGSSTPLVFGTDSLGFIIFLGMACVLLLRGTATQLDELYRYAVPRLQVGNTATGVRTFIDHPWIVDGLDVELNRDCDGSVDVIHVEGHVREARIAGSRHYRLSVRRRQVLDQFEAMTWPLDERDDDVSSVNTRDVRNRLRIARCFRKQLESQAFGEERDRSIQIANREAGVVGSDDVECCHQVLR